MWSVHTMKYTLTVDQPKTGDDVSTSSVSICIECQVTQNRCSTLNFKIVTQTLSVLHTSSLWKVVITQEISLQTQALFPESPSPRQLTAYDIWDREQKQMRGQHEDDR